MIPRKSHFIILAAFAILLVPGIVLAQAGSTAKKAGTAKAVKAKTTGATVDDSPPNKTMGSRSAPITIEVFSDYECPACGLLYTETLRPLIDDYVATGKVYLVHRDFPLAMHPYSKVAARLVNAAAKIGRFEKAESAIYTKRESWERSGNLDAALATVLTPAELQRVKQIAESGKMDPFIESDMALGNSRNIHQTPSLFVTYGGQTEPLPPGGVTYRILKSYLDEKLGH